MFQVLDPLSRVALPVWYETNVFEAGTRFMQRPNPRAPWSDLKKADQLFAGQSARERREAFVCCSAVSGLYRV